MTAHAFGGTFAKPHKPTPKPSFAKEPPSQHTTEKGNMNEQMQIERKKYWLQHCIKAIAGVVVKSRPVHLINFCGGGQVIPLKSATALILDRCV